MDSLFEELVAVDSQKALAFFLSGLKQAAAEKRVRVRDAEICYVASVLAHYSQTSRCDTNSMPVLSNLSEVFDTFVWAPMNNPDHPVSIADAEILEIGGSQVLLFAGFFRDQMRRRHNVHWFDELGQSLYGKAGERSSEHRKRELFFALSESFPLWTHLCSNFSRKARDNRFILRAN